MACAFTIMLSLFLLLSVSAFSKEYTLCQDELPKISYLPFTLSWVVTLILFNLTAHKKFLKYRKPIIITVCSIAALFFGAIVTLTELDLLCSQYLMALLRISSVATMIMFILLPFFIVCYKKKIDSKYARLINTLKDSDEPEMPLFARQKQRI